MTKTWVVTTSTEVITEYTVEAETEQDAYDNFWEGQWTNEKEIDYRNEEIIEAKELEQSIG